MNHKLLLEQQLLNTSDAARVIGCSAQALANMRTGGGGPAYLRITTRRIRYRASDLEAWLGERKHHSTSEYVSRRKL